MKRRIGKGIALAFVAMVVCRAEVVAQGNPWNNPIVSPRVDTGGEVTFSVCAPSASRVELSGQFMEGTCPMRKGELVERDGKSGKNKIYKRARGMPDGISFPKLMPRVFSVVGRGALCGM